MSSLLFLSLCDNEPGPDGEACPACGARLAEDEWPYCDRCADKLAGVDPGDDLGALDEAYEDEPLRVWAGHIPLDRVLYG
jgi:predicted amidophosphoribosyltransferase